MKIVYFTRDYTTHDHRFLGKLARTSHSVFFLRLEDDGLEYESRPVPGPVVTVEWQGGRRPVRNLHECLGLMPDLERVLTEIRPDLVHAGPIQTCAFMSALAGARPLVVMSWGSDILVDANRDETWRWITRFTLQRADGVVSDCDAVTTRIKAFVPFPAYRIAQFPWGVELSRLLPAGRGTAVRDALGIGRDRLVILSTRSWEPTHGLPVLLEAVKQAQVREPRILLLLLARGSLEPFVRRFIEEHRLTDSVLTPGIVSQEKLPGYYQLADLYASCTPSDGSSISLLEAMASGLPVVVADAAGNREWVREGENGWLAAVGDAGAFASAILRATALSVQEREAIGRRNRAIATHRADWDKNVERLLELYGQLHPERAPVERG